MGPSKTLNKPCAKDPAKACLATARLCPLFLSQLNRYIALLIPFLSADLGTVDLVQSGMLPRLACQGRRLGPSCPLISNCQRTDEKLTP